MKKIIVFCLLMFGCFVLFQNNFILVGADELTDNINNQLENIDLSGLESYFNNVKGLPEGIDFFTYLIGLLNGTFNVDFNSFTTYFVNVFMSDVKDIMPMFISLFAIAVFCGVVQNLRSSFLSESIGDLILFVCLLSIILILSTHIITLIKDVEIIIKNIANLTEIMSPIIITLMLASGGKVSASVYKPSVTFLSNGVIDIFLFAIIPLVGLFTVFNTVTSFSNTIRLTKFSELTVSTIKWIIGLTVTVFGVFLSVQGITSATFDGISIKATKYAISNSVPLVGGLLKDGFDMVIAGSVLIKNAVGIMSLIALLFTLLNPVLYLWAFSFLLKVVSAITEPITDVRISSFFMSMSKTVTYLTVILLAVGLMFFITIMLLIMSANAFL